MFRSLSLSPTDSVAQNIIANQVICLLSRKNDVSSHQYILIEIHNNEDEFPFVWTQTHTKKNDAGMLHAFQSIFVNYYFECV